MPGEALPPTVWHTLRARDARALISFLVDAFGFEETVVYGEGDRSTTPSSTGRWAAA